MKASSEAVMTALGYSTQDLALNQQGELSPQQRAFLESLQRRAVVIGLIGFFGMTLLATTFLFFGLQNDAWVLSLIGVFVTILNAIFVGMYGRQWMRLRLDLNKGAVEVLQGELVRVIKAQGRANNYVVRIAEREFYVKKEVFQAFAHEHPYHVYQAPYSKVLLGAQPDGD